MIARKCDRCDSFYIPYDSIGTYTVSRKSFVDTQIDLCPECHNNLIAFMENTDMIPVYLKYKNKNKMEKGIKLND